MFNGWGTSRGKWRMLPIILINCISLQLSWSKRTKRMSASKARPKWRKTDGWSVLKLIQIHDPVLQHITSKEIPTETQRLRQCACDIVDHQSFSNYLTFIFYLSFSEDFQLSQLAGSPKDFKIISCFSV